MKGLRDVYTTLNFAYTDTFHGTFLPQALVRAQIIVSLQHLVLQTKDGMQTNFKLDWDENCHHE